MVTMTPKQHQESLPVSQFVVQESSGRVKPYTLEDFSYDYFRYTQTHTCNHVGSVMKEFRYRVRD